MRNNLQQSAAKHSGAKQSAVQRSKAQHSTITSTLKEQAL